MRKRHGGTVPVVPPVFKGTLLRLGSPFFALTLLISQGLSLQCFQDQLSTMFSARHLDAQSLHEIASGWKLKLSPRIDGTLSAVGDTETEEAERASGAVSPPLSLPRWPAMAI